MTTMAKLVGVERARSRAGARADQRAFPAAREAADACAAERRPGHRQLVAMLLPESPSMTTMAYGLRRSDRPRRENQSQGYQETRQKLFHEILPFSNLMHGWAVFYNSHATNVQSRSRTTRDDP